MVVQEHVGYMCLGAPYLSVSFDAAVDFHLMSNVDFWADYSEASAL